VQGGEREKREGKIGKDREDKGWEKREWKGREKKEGKEVEGTPVYIFEFLLE